MFKNLSAAVVLLATTMAAPAFAEGDVTQGKKVYFKCMKCHSMTRDRHKKGPTMYQIVGRQAGVARGFDYSRAFGELADNGVIWDEANLSEFLKKPRAYAKGTRMKFSGIEDEQQRKDLIAYLKTM